MARCICTALETTAHQGCPASAVFGPGFLREALQGLCAFMSPRLEDPQPWLHLGHKSCPG